jgi:exonuclease III
MISEFSPEFICLQETKTMDFPSFFGYNLFYSAYSSVNHHGVASYVKNDPFTRVIEIDPRLAGHALFIEHRSVIVVNAYVKNSGQDNNLRRIFDQILWSEIDRFKDRKLIVAGDLNVCLNMDDHYTGKSDEKVAGRKMFEKEHINAMVNKFKLKDAYMSAKYTNGFKWTFKSQRYGRVETVNDMFNKGDVSGLWRLDYILVSQDITFESVKTIPSITTSDHIPVIAVVATGADTHV